MNRPFLWHLATFVLVAGSSLLALTPDEFVTKSKNLRRLADRFVLTDLDKTTFKTDATTLVQGRGVASADQVLQLKGVLEDARWGGMFGETVELELDNLLGQLSGTVAGTTTAGAVPYIATTIGDPSIALGIRVESKRREFYSIPRTNFTQYRSDNFLQELQVLVDEAPGAYSEEFSQLRNALDGFRLSLHYRELSTDTSSTVSWKQSARTKLQEMYDSLDNITYSQRLGYLGRIDDGVTFKSTSQQKRFMDHLTSLVDSVADATPEERDWLVGLMQSAEVLLFSTHTSAIKALRWRIPSTAGEMSTQVPMPGTIVAFASLVKDSRTGKELSKYLKVERNEFGKNSVVASGDTGLDPACQFETVLSADGTKIGFRSAESGGMFLGIAVDAYGAGQIGFSKTEMSGDAERFTMIGTKEEASFRNEATRGFLSINEAKILMSLREEQTTTSDNEKFKIVELTPLMVSLSSARKIADLTRLDRYINVMDKADITADERVALIREMREFVHSKRLTKALWAISVSNDTLMAKLSGLLVSLFSRPAYQGYSGYIKEMLDILAIEQQRAIALAPRMGKYVWLVDKPFIVASGESAKFSAEVFATADVRIALSDAIGVSDAEEPLYEFRFGIDNNTRSALFKRGVEVASFVYSIQQSMYKEIWVSEENGMLKAGTGEIGLNRLIEWQDPETPLNVEYIGIGSGNAPVWWRDLEVATSAFVSSVVSPGGVVESYSDLIVRLEKDINNDQVASSTILGGYDALVQRRIEASDEDIEKAAGLMNKALYHKRFFGVPTSEATIRNLVNMIQTEVSLDDRIAYGWAIKEWPDILQSYQEEAFLSNAQRLVDRRFELKQQNKLAGVESMFMFSVQNQFRNKREKVEGLLKSLQFAVRIDELGEVLKSVTNNSGRDVFMERLDPLIVDAEDMAKSGVLQLADRQSLEALVGSAKENPVFVDATDAELDAMLMRVRAAEGFERAIADLKAALGAVDTQEERDSLAASLGSLVSDVETMRDAGSLRDADRDAVVALSEEIKGNWYFNAPETQVQISDMIVRLQRPPALPARVKMLTKKLSSVASQLDATGVMTDMRTVVSD
ncbi:hypothetical protein KAT92_00595, partial [Candidatus Babeliales bacterium]|nr:hypothetical protein [Candidatus Babeliales bacterium]